MFGFQTINLNKGISHFELLTTKIEGKKETKC